MKASLLLGENKSLGWLYIVEHISIASLFPSMDCLTCKTMLLSFIFYSNAYLHFFLKNPKTIVLEVIITLNLAIYPIGASLTGEKGLEGSGSNNAMTFICES